MYLEATNAFERTHGPNYQRSPPHSAMVDDIMDLSIMQAGYTQLKNEIWNTYEVVSSVVAYAEGSPINMTSLSILKQIARMEMLFLIASKWNRFCVI